MAGAISLDTAAQRVDAGKSAGENYTQELEDIQNTLNSADGEGSTLGSMVKAQLSITEAETTYQVTSGLPTKVSKSVQAAAQAVKQA